MVYQNVHRILKYYLFQNHELYDPTIRWATRPICYSRWAPALLKPNSDTNRHSGNWEQNFLAQECNLPHGQPRDNSSWHDTGCSAFYSPHIHNHDDEKTQVRELPIQLSYFTEKYFRLFFYIIGSLYYTTKLDLFTRTPKHEKTILTEYSLEFLSILQESDSPLIGMFG